MGRMMSAITLQRHLKESRETNKYLRATINGKLDTIDHLKKEIKTLNNKYLSAVSELNRIKRMQRLT